MASRFSEIAHEGILLWNPLPETATLEFVDALPLAPTARVLDVGCGRGELLVRLLARSGASGVGIDAWPGALAQARAAAHGRVDRGRLELRGEPFDAERVGAAAFDLALCVGATHALGGYVAALHVLHRLLVPGGAALVGEGHWMQEPDLAYLEFLGAPRDSLRDLAGTADLARAAGFEVVRTLVSTRDDFDRYEDRYAANVERFAATHPDDPDASAFLERIRAWRRAYVRWGRDTLGFALYELRRADGADG